MEGTGTGPRPRARDGRQRGAVGRRAAPAGAHADVGQVRVVAGAHQDVGGAHVAVDEPARGEMVQRRPHLGQDPLQAARVDAAGRAQQRRERRAVDQPHRDERDPVGLARLVHRHDVGVVDLPRGVGGAHRARQIGAAGGGSRKDQLERHDALAGDPRGPVDDARLAAADLRLDAVPVHHGADVMAHRETGSHAAAPGAAPSRHATMAPMPPLIPLRDLFDNPERAAARLSPDGARLSWLAPREGVLNVWVRDRAGGEAVPVTDDRDRGIHSYLWSRDSRRILYSQDVGGDENHHLLTVDADGARPARDLTPFPGVRAGLIAAPRATPRHVLVSMNLRDRSLFDAYRLTLATGRLELVGRNPGNILGWTADRQGRLRAAMAQTPAGDYEILVRDDEAGRAARRGRVRQRGRWPPLRLHPRRLPALGGQRPWQRPDAPGRARSRRRLRARDRPGRRGRPRRSGRQRPHRRAPRRLLPARPRRAARLRRAPGARLGGGAGAAPGRPAHQRPGRRGDAFWSCLRRRPRPGRHLPLRPRERRGRVPLPLAPVARPRRPSRRCGR